MDARIESFATRSLADSSYLLAVGSDALLVDPQRDAWRFLAAAEARGLTVRYVLETHVHNDYVSGALEVRAATGAEVLAPAAGRYEFVHRGLSDGDEIDLDGVVIRALATPGHTPEHLSYLVAESAAPVAVFTGGCLIHGSAGRTDLLGDERAEELTRAQYRSVRLLAGLSDATRLLPTHGAGSFCAAAAPRTASGSTIGAERVANPALLAPDEEAFVRRQLDGLPRYPAYYRHMAPLNRAGPPLLSRLPDLPARSPAEVAARGAAGAWVVDGRDRLSFAAAHLPGSVNVELDDAFASYVGWIVPFGAPLLLVLPDPPDTAAAEATGQLLRIGYEQVEGYLAGGVAAWQASGRPVRHYPVATVDDLLRAAETAHPRVLDVRQPAEWAAGTLPGSLRVFVGDLPGRVDGLPRDAELWTVCATGHRAAMAASLLDRAGIPVRLVAKGGLPAETRPAAGGPATGR
jgi:hydroxyacylglutathione hydrolase